MNQPALAKLAPADGLDSSLETETSFADSSRVQRKRGPRLRMILVSLLILAGLIWGARYVRHLLTHAETDDAYLTSYVHYVNAHVPGTISEVDVAENGIVKPGDVMFRLDPRDHE